MTDAPNRLFCLLNIVFFAGAFLEHQREQWAANFTQLHLERYPFPVFIENNVQF